MLAAMTLQDRVRVHEVTLLSDNWYTLKTTSPSTGAATTAAGSACTARPTDRGNGAFYPGEAYNRARRTKLLTRQFRCTRPSSTAGTTC